MTTYLVKVSFNNEVEATNEEEAIELFREDVDVYYPEAQSLVVEVVAS